MATKDSDLTDKQNKILTGYEEKAGLIIRKMITVLANAHKRIDRYKYSDALRQIKK